MKQIHRCQCELVGFLKCKKCHILLCFNIYFLLIHILVSFSYAGMSLTLVEKGNILKMALCKFIKIFEANFSKLPEHNKCKQQEMIVLVLPQWMIYCTDTNACKMCKLHVNSAQIMN